MRSLRARLSLGVGLVLALVLGVSGVLISNYAERTAREALDDRLRRTAELSRATIVDALEDAVPGTDRRLNAVLRATDSSLRLFLDDQVVLEAGRPALVPGAPATGLRTVNSRGNAYRVLVTPLEDAGLGDLAKLEVVSSMADLQRRQDELDTRLTWLGLVALLVAGIGVFLAAGRTLGPLRRLRLAAGRIAAEDDLDVRVSETDGPAEVRGLAASFNAMLSRLSASAAQRERALEATRRFAFDAGHELRTPLTTVQTTLSALHRHPDVSAEERAAMLEDALSEQRRLVELLDGLQALARGEGTRPELEEVDLADVVTRAVGETQPRYPATTFALDLPATPVVLCGLGAGAAVARHEPGGQRRPPRPRRRERARLAGLHAAGADRRRRRRRDRGGRSRPDLRAVPAARQRRGAARLRPRARARRPAGPRARRDRAGGHLARGRRALRRPLANREATLRRL